MTATQKSLVDAVRPSTTSAETLYTAAAGVTTRILKFTAYETSANADSFDLFIVPNGGSATATNRIMTNKAVAADATEDIAEVINHILPAGASLQVQVTTADRVAFRVSGIEYT